MTQTFKALILASSLGLLLSGCVYKINIQQGNLITNQDLAKIHRGMSTKAVQKILGEPLLRNVYKDNRMVYVYTMKRGHRKMTRRNLTVYFVGNKVVRVSAVGTNH